MRLAARSWLPAGEGHELGVGGREGAELRRGLPALGPGRAERRAAAHHGSATTATKARARPGRGGKEWARPAAWHVCIVCVVTIVIVVVAAVVVVVVAAVVVAAAIAAAATAAAATAAVTIVVVVVATVARPPPRAHVPHEEARVDLSAW